MPDSPSSAGVDFPNSQPITPPSETPVVQPQVDSGVDLIPPGPPVLPAAAPPIHGSSIPPMEELAPPPPPPLAQDSSVVVQETVREVQPVSPATISYKIPANHPDHPIKTKQRSIPRSVQPQGVTAKDHACIQYLQNVYQNPENFSGYFICLFRDKPTTWHSAEVQVKLLEEIDIYPFSALREMIVDKWGGGEFRIEVRNANGTRMHWMSFCIPPITQPPKNLVRGPNGQLLSVEVGLADFYPPSPATPAGVVPGGQQNMNRYQPYGAFGVPQTEPAIQELKTQEMTLESQGRLENKRWTLAREQKKRERIDREEQEVEAAARREAGGRNGRSAMAELLEKMDQNRKEDFGLLQSTFKDLFQGMQSMMVPLLGGNKDKDSALVVELLKQSAESNRQFMTVMMEAGKSGKGELASAMEAASKTNERFLAMAMDSSKIQQAKGDKLLELVLSTKLGQQDDKVGEFIKAFQMGKTDQKDLMEMVQGMQGTEEGAAYDPEAGFFGNVGGLIFDMLKSVAGGGYGALGGKIMDLMAARLGKPAGTRNYTQDEIRGVARQLEQETPQTMPAALPAPGSPELTANQVAKLEVAEAVPMAVLSSAIPSTPISPTGSNEPSPFISEIYDEGLNGRAPADEGDANERLLTDVNELVSMAIEDVTDLRVDPDWPDYGFGKLSQGFKDLLFKAPSDVARLELLKQNCDEKIWSHLYNLLVDSAYPQRMQFFNRGLTALIARIGEGAPAFVQ